MAFRFLHAADLHLGSPLRGLAARDASLAALFEDAGRRAFRGVVDLALGEQVDFVVIAGDVFDRDWKDFSVGQAFVREIARLPRAGIRVVMIRGNHDAESVVSRDLPLPDGVVWLGTDRPETVDLPEIGAAVHGIGFKTRAVTEGVVRRYPDPRPGRFNLGLLHTSLTDRPGHDRYAPCSLADLAARGYDYWALGHIHAREVVGEAGAPVVFPGNIQGRSIRETGAKGVTLVTVDGTRATALEHRAVDAARWAVAEVDLGGAATADAVEARVRRAVEDAASAADGRPLALRLRLVGERPPVSLAEDRSPLRERLQAVAGAVSDTIAVEKVVSALLEPAVAAVPAVAADLADALDAVLGDEALAASIDADLARIREKIPTGGRPLVETDRTAILAAARALLLDRLGSR